MPKIENPRGAIENAADAEVFSHYPGFRETLDAMCDPYARDAVPLTFEETVAILARDWSAISAMRRYLGVGGRGYARSRDVADEVRNQLHFAIVTALRSTIENQNI